MYSWLVCCSFLWILSDEVQTCMKYHLVPKLRQITLLVFLDSVMPTTKRTSTTSGANMPVTSQKEQALKLTVSMEQKHRAVQSMERSPSTYKWRIRSHGRRKSRCSKHLTTTLVVLATTFLMLLMQRIATQMGETILSSIHIIRSSGVTPDPRCAEFTT